MEFVIYLSNFVMPFVVAFIVGYGLLKKTDVFDEFIKGASDGVRLVVGIMPTLVGLMVAVGVVRASGLFEWIGDIAKPVAQAVHFPVELIPLSIVKMFSSSAATGLLLDIFKDCGADSYAGRVASIMMSCTETIFYTMSVYFLSAKISRTRWTLMGALISTIAGTVMAVLLAGMM